MGKEKGKRTCLTLQKMDMIPRHQCVVERKRKTDVEKYNSDLASAKKYNSDLTGKRETDVKNSDLTSAKDGNDSGAPVVLQSSLSFLDLLQTPAMTMHCIAMMLTNTGMVVVVTTKMLLNLVNEILEGQHLDLWPRFQL